MATDQVLNVVTQTLVNVTGGTEIGTTLPPKQVGEFRIPFVKNLRLGPQSSYFGGTQFTLLWDEPDTTESISHYNVFTVGELAGNTAPLGPYSTVTSPAIFRVTANSAGVITFFVQTQLHNGNCSEIASSPSVTSQVSPPQIKTGDVTPGTILPSFGVTLYLVPKDTDYHIPSLDDGSHMLPPTCICVNPNSVPANIYLPLTPYAGQIFYIKKANATAFAVTIIPQGATNIDGAATYVIPGGAFGSVTLIWTTPDPNQPGVTYLWQVVSKF